MYKEPPIFSYFLIMNAVFEMGDLHTLKIANSSKFVFLKRWHSLMIFDICIPHLKAVPFWGIFIRKSHISRVATLPDFSLTLKPLFLSDNFL